MDAEPPIVVTLGEPAGIGPELIAMAWQQRQQAALPPFYCIADPAFLRQRIREARLPGRLVEIANAEAAATAFGDGIPVLALEHGVRSGKAGRPAVEDAAAVLEAITRGVEGIRHGEARAIVTAPVQKETLYASGFPFPGHTELLGGLTHDWPGGGQPPVMMLVAEELRVVPVTVHLPLAEVPDRLTTELIVRTARTVAAEMAMRFGVEAPRLAIAGLNPHAGEGGRLGVEEETVIGPAIDQLRAEGIDAAGPIPGDTMFHPAGRAGYDVALAMYHDQALIPIKTIAFDSAVNVTLGLPLVRTSPDHGTALALAGTGEANPRSFIEAIRLADRLSRR